MANRLIKSLDGLLESPVAVHTLADLVAGMNHRGMVPSTESLANGRVGRTDDFARQIHRNLACQRDMLRAPLGADLGDREAEMGGDGVLNLGDAGRCDDPPGLSRENFLSKPEVHLPVGQGSHRAKAGDGPFDLTHVISDAFRNKVTDFIGDFQSGLDCLGLDDGDPGLDLRGLDIRGQTPFEPIPKAFFQIRNILGEFVGSQDDLLVRLMQRIEGMEELFLSSFAAGQELRIVQNEQVHLAEAVLEIRHLVLSQRGDQIVDERFAGEISDLGSRIFLENPMPDGIDQMGFADPDGSIDEKRVVEFARLGGHSQSRRMSKLVARADHKGVKGVALYQVAAPCS